MNLGEQPSQKTNLLYFLILLPHLVEINKQSKGEREKKKQLFFISFHLFFFCLQMKTFLVSLQLNQPFHNTF